MYIRSLCILPPSRARVKSLMVAQLKSIQNAFHCLFRFCSIHHMVPEMSASFWKILILGNFDLEWPLVAPILAWPKNTFSNFECSCWQWQIQDFHRQLASCHGGGIFPRSRLTGAAWHLRRAAAWLGKAAFYLLMTACWIRGAAAFLGRHCAFGGPRVTAECGMPASYLLREAWYL